jgi:hypothetical protein
VPCEGNGEVVLIRSAINRRRQRILEGRPLTACRVMPWLTGAAGRWPMREDAGMTQRELAARLKRPQTWVHKSEVGERRVDIAEFLEWCVGCGADPSRAFADLIRARR